MTRIAHRQDLIDWAMAVVVAAGAVLQQSTCGCRVDPLWLNVGVILLITLPIGLRRHQPVPVFFLTGLASLLHILLGFSNQFLDTFAVLVALFSVAYYAPWSLSVLAAAAAALALPFNFLIDWTNHGHIDLNDIPYNYALFGAAWILGDNLRQRRERERELERRAVQLQAEQDELARRRVAEERARIARDLHDVVAHALSVIVLQAGAARRIAAAQPERARAVLAAIESVGREAAADMRRLVGILRTNEDAGAEHEPQPSLAMLDTLAERVRSTGLEVTVRTEGQPRQLPPGVDLSAYRIIQEALTNTLRHAGAVRAQVVVRYRASSLELEIADDGAGPSADGSSAGQGLIGMRERVTLFGGELEAGSREDGGFRVRAHLPVEISPS